MFSITVVKNSRLSHLLILGIFAVGRFAVGLTIHYEMTVPKKWSNQTIREKLEALRQACMDMAVVEVSELQEFKGDECAFADDKGEPFRWAKIQAARRLESSWNLSEFYFQLPNHAILFTVTVAPGCEPMNLGVRDFSPFVCPKRHVDANGRLAKPAWSLAVEAGSYHPGATKVLKDFTKKWQLHRLPFSDSAHRTQKTLLFEEFYSVRIVEGRHISHRRGSAPSWVMVELADRNKDYIRWRFTGTLQEAPALFTSDEFKADMERLVSGEEYRIPGEMGTWASFCKTQFANEHGLPNFLRAHMTVCAVLEKAQELGFKVRVKDEGEFWTKRDVKALAEEVGKWDQMIAAMFGAIKDAAPEGVLESPIQKRSDFEHLEMKGIQAGYGVVAGKIADYLAKLKLPKPEEE
jgi:hypothetical protein